MGDPLRGMAAGACAGAFEATITCPLDTIKVRLQALDHSGKVQLRRGNPLLKIFATGRGIVENEGFLALWKGWGPLVSGVMVKKAIRFSSFAQYKATFSDKKGKLSNSHRFLGGVVAGTIETVTVVTPSEMVKVRLQTEKGKTSCFSHSV